MPQYVYVVNGQRHVFEGPDPQTTAQFAQRWAAAQPAGRTSVAENDNRPQLSPRRSQFAMDIGARAKQDLADLTGSIAQVRAHPTDPMNVYRTLSAVTRYVPNALGLVPAAVVDQATGPAVRGINSRFGTHYSPRYATDQILNGVGLLTGGGEMSAAERFEGMGGDRLLHAMGKLREASVTANPKPKLTLVPSVYGPHTPEELEPEGEPEEIPVVSLTDGFNFNHQKRLQALQGLPGNVQKKYNSAVGRLIINPLLDDPDYGGHNSADVKYIRDKLGEMAARQRGLGGSEALADALDGANADFRTMVVQQQPEMARQLGLVRPADFFPAAPSTPQPDAPGKIVSLAERKLDLARPDDAIPAAASTREPADSPTEGGDIVNFAPPRRSGLDAYLSAMESGPDVEQPDLRGEIVSFAQHAPPSVMGGVDRGPLYLGGLSFEKRLEFLAKLREMKAAADPAPEPAPEPAAPGFSAGMKTAADNGSAWLKGASSGAGQAAMNAFAGPARIARSIATGAPNFINGANFNSILPSELDDWPPQSIILAPQQPSLDQKPQYFQEPR